MTDDELVLARRAAARGWIPPDAVDRARRDCRRPLTEWLLDEKLLTQDQLRDLLEAEQPALPRAATGDSAWAAVILVSIIGVVFLGGIALSRISAERRRAGEARAAAMRQQGRWILKAGEMMLAQQDYGSATVHFTNALRQDPQSGEAYVGRARAQLALGNATSALEDAEQALALEPKNPAAILVRAKALLALSRAREAAADLETIDPSPERDALLEEARKKAAEK